MREEAGQGNGQEESSLRNEYRFNDFGMSDNTAPPPGRNIHPIFWKMGPLTRLDNNKKKPGHLDAAALTTHLR